MRQISTFDRLVAGLSTEERRGMLRSIEENLNIDSEPLFADAEESEEISLEVIHGRLGLIHRIILFFKALIVQRNVLDVLEESLLLRYAAEIERAYQGLFDAKTNSLGYAFAKELKGLRDALAPFVDPLSRAFGPDKKDFVAFMAGIEFPLHQERILEVTDPATYFGDGVSDFDMRRQMDAALKEALKDISESDRAEMYRHVRALYFLNELVFFPHSKILSSFTAGAERETVPVGQVKNQLLEFGDILVSQVEAPGITALKALFLFDPKMNEEQDIAKTTDVLKAALEGALQGLAEIRSFCTAIPLKKLLKVVSENVSYTPDQIGGGEDWFALYRKFWEDRIDRELEIFSFSTHSQKLVGEACRLLKMDALPTLPHYSAKSLEDGGGVRFEMTLSFLLHFIERLFMTEMHRVLKIFIVDGDFYKSLNRQEFTDSYDGIRGAMESIKHLDADLSPTGEKGLEVSLVRGEMVKQNLRYKRLRSVLKTVDERAEGIVNSTKEHLALLIHVTKGILFGESGGRYDTLSNISYIGGSENASLLDRLNRALKQSEEGQRVMNELYDLERSIH